MDRSTQFPIGASVTVEALTQSPYDLLAQLRADEPVSWIPALNAWWVTPRDLALEAMSDAETFTVDDDRFTTARILGTSMLNLDGPEHKRHRTAFVPPFRPKFLREELEERIMASATRLWDNTITGDGETRTGIAGPLAVETILDLMGLDVATEEVLSWYSAFGQAITALTVGDDVPDVVDETLTRLKAYVSKVMEEGGNGFITSLVDDEILHLDEIPAAVAVILFGAIETSEAMTVNMFWHLFTHPETLERVRSDRSIIPDIVNESLRLEPAASWVDRYTTREVELGNVTIPKGDLVSISLLGANRDPAVFPDPDRFDIDRPNLAQHLTFVKGPHTCLGLHVARAETSAALVAALDWEERNVTHLILDSQRSAAPEGLIFRRADSVVLTAP